MKLLAKSFGYFIPQWVADMHLPAIDKAIERGDLRVYEHQPDDLPDDKAVA